MYMIGIFLSLISRLLRRCTISILWGSCAIAVLNSGMSQELVQLVDQYIQLVGGGAMVKKKSVVGWLINLFIKAGFTLQKEWQKRPDKMLPFQRLLQM